MMELVECFLEIYCHGDVQYAVLVVPVQCDATVNTPVTILCYFIFFLKFIYEVLDVLSFLVFDSKVINH